MRSYSYISPTRLSSLFTPALTSLSLLVGAASAQVVLPPGSLASPIGIIADHHDKLWISESGDGTGTTGQVSRYHPATGILQVELSGFPSELHEGQPTGVHHIAWDPSNVHALNIAMGGTNGHLQTWDVSTGTLMPGQDFDIRSYAIAQGLPTGAGQPDSNIYSVAVDAAGDHYVVDAGANAIIKVDTTGVMSIFAQFPNFPVLGPPFVGQQAVPTKILWDGAGGFWVCNLTGGPFFAGVASVFHVDSAGVVVPIQTGFTTLVDMAIDPTDGNLVVLSWGQFDLNNGFLPFTGTITKLTSTGPQAIASGLMLPTGMAYTSNGDLYVHSYALGSLEKIPSANANSYGTGCGSPALVMTPTGMPAIGGMASAAIQNVPSPQTIGAVALGYSNTTSMGGSSLPMDLTSLGMPGCHLLQSGEALGLALTPNLGTVLQFGIAIPNDTLLLGLHFYTQAYCFAPGQNAFAVIVSNGVDWIVGHP